LINLKVLKK